MTPYILENDEVKYCCSDDYKFEFNKKTGYFRRWGRTFEDDPQWSPYGNEILDIEVTTSCNGIANQEGVESPCRFCFPAGTKILTPNGEKNIEDLKKSDVVCSFDTVTRLSVQNSIQETYKRFYRGELITVVLANGKRLRVTPNHEFYTESGWVRAENLKDGMNLISVLKKTCRIAKIIREKFEGDVYNFHCLPSENYFSEGVLVHNCYKSNSKNGQNMSFEMFKTIIDFMPKTLCQIAFGADAKAESNPDLWKMMAYTRSRGIVPNITVAQVTEKNVDNLVKYCGAVSVSRYENKDICYNSVKALTDKGLKQVNIHQMVSASTYDQTLDTFQDYLHDDRLKKLNAIVLLSLKRVGRGVSFAQLPKEKFALLINYALEHKVPIGMDSCFCSSFLRIVKNHPHFKEFLRVAEPCESTAMSAFISVDGKFSACSFTPKDSFSLDATKEPFINLWLHPEVVAFRTRLLNTCANNELGCRECPIYEI